MLLTQRNKSLKATYELLSIEKRKLYNLLLCRTAFFASANGNTRKFVTYNTFCPIG